MNKQECPFLSDAGVDVASPENGIEICLNCPRYPKPCIYEVTTRTKRKIQIRRAKVKALCDEGKSNAEIARLLKVSEATIYNDVRVKREGQ